MSSQDMSKRQTKVGAMCKGSRLRRGGVNAVGGEKVTARLGTNYEPIAV